MHRDGDRWDIEIVGLTAPTAAIAGQVAQVFERATGRRAPALDLDPVHQELAIAVQRGVSHARARRTAAALESAGAVVKLRPSADSNDEVIELEADSDDLEFEGDAGEPDDLSALAKKLEVAASGELVELDGAPGSFVPSPASRSPTKRPPIPTASRSEPTSSPNATKKRPMGEAALELDFERAGMVPAAPMAPAAPMDARSPLSPSGKADGAVEARTGASSGPRLRAAASQPSPAPLRRRFLLGSDRVAALLWGGAIGLVVGVVPAMQVARNHARDVLSPLEAEMAEAVRRPLAARAGTIAGPDDVQSKLDVAYRQGRQRFVWTWLGVAVPLGLGLAFIPRPATR